MKTFCLYSQSPEILLKWRSQSGTSSCLIQGLPFRSVLLLADFNTWLSFLGRCLVHNVQLTVHTQVSFAGSSSLECLLNTNILDVLALLSSCLFLFMLHTYKPLKLWFADGLPALILSWSLPNQPIHNITHPPLSPHQNRFYHSCLLSLWAESPSTNCSA